MMSDRNKHVLKPGHVVDIDNFHSCTEIVAPLVRCGGNRLKIVRISDELVTEKCLECSHECTWGRTQFDGFPKRILFDDDDWEEEEDENT